MSTTNLKVQSTSESGFSSILLLLLSSFILLIVITEHQKISAYYAIQTLNVKGDFKLEYLRAAVAQASSTSQMDQSNSVRDLQCNSSTIFSRKLCVIKAPSTASSLSFPLFDVRGVFVNASPCAQDPSLRVTAVSPTSNYSVYSCKPSVGPLSASLQVRGNIDGDLSKFNLTGTPGKELLISSTGYINITKGMDVSENWTILAGGDISIDSISFVGSGPSKLEILSLTGAIKIGTIDGIGATSVLARLGYEGVAKTLSHAPPAGIPTIPLIVLGTVLTK